MSRPADDIKTCVCGARYVQRRHERTGKYAPIEHAPSEKGNCRILANGDYAIIPKADVATYAGDKYLNHFAYCPSRRKFGGRS